MIYIYIKDVQTHIYAYIHIVLILFGGTTTMKG